MQHETNSVISTPIIIPGDDLGEITYELLTIASVAHLYMQG